MRSFSELLRTYTEQTGISDAELARAIGVRRQTIFRWKEGTVSRPRSREDVLALTHKLRLTPAETDELLIAAGFHPEGDRPTPAPLPASPDPIPDEALRAQLPTTFPAVDRETKKNAEIPEAFSGSRLLWLAASGILLLALLAAVWFFRGEPLPLAAPGETLVIVGQFTNFTGGQVGFNVAGRIADPLHQEIENAQLSGVRVAVWSNPIRSEAEAQSLLARSAAWMIIWGEFDSGRVLARFTQSEGTTSPPALESLVASPDDLFATINTALPQEVRYLALLTLGALYADTGDYPRARAVLVRANTTPPQERDAQVTLLFRLGLVHQLGENPQTDETIGYYTQLLQLAPDHLLARYNRGLAYLARNQAGDWDRAVADFDGVIQRSPGYLAARIGRGVAFLYRREPGDEEAALADFGYVIERDDQRPMAFYNRGLLAIRRNNRSLWEGDLLRTIELAPDFAGGYSALCWGYVLDAEAQAALPPCERALALGAQEALHSRSLAYAASGDLALAAADLRAFLAWLDQQPAASPYGIYAGPSAQWLAEMEAGKNPLTPELLSNLRQE